jgi:hypothetical protein
MTFPWIDILKEVGPFVAILIFFIWRDWKREQRLTEQVEALAAYQRDTLENLVEKTISALTQGSECIKWIGRVLEHLVRVCPRMVGRDCDKPDTL